MPREAERVLVLEAVDGDTLLLVDGRRVRVLGIDAPETRHPEMRGPQPLGPEAARRLAELVEGRRVVLERGAVDVDHYGRLLRHVWVEGRLAGDLLVGERLLREGLASSLILESGGRHEERLRAAETAARSAGRGLWGLDRPTPLPIFQGR